MQQHAGLSEFYRAYIGEDYAQASQVETSGTPKATMTATQARARILLSTTGPGGHGATPTSRVKVRVAQPVKRGSIEVFRPQVRA
jgi:hypothetical protein